jgi:hypothetical protein
MGKINTGKVILGGLVAGLVFNVLDFVNNGFIMREDFAANSTRLGLDPGAAEAPAAIATWVVIDFLLGILTVWIYAAIRPRFGPGPKTAVLAGAMPYLGISLILYGFTAMGILTPALYWKATLLQLIIVVLGSVAGAALYKEE